VNRKLAFLRVTILLLEGNAKLRKDGPSQGPCIQEVGSEKVAFVFSKEPKWECIVPGGSNCPPPPPSLREPSHFLQRVKKRLPQPAQGFSILPGHVVRVELKLCHFPCELVPVPIFLDQDVGVVKHDSMTDIVALFLHGFSGKYGQM
jgi:hypothetical protein